MQTVDQFCLQINSPYRYSAELSHRPCTVKGLKDYLWPDKAMAELLSNLQNKG